MSPTILSPFQAITYTQATTVFCTILSTVLAIASTGHHYISQNAKHCTARELNQLLQTKWVGTSCRLADNLVELQPFDNYRNTQVDWGPSMYAQIYVAGMPVTSRLVTGAARD